MDRSECILAVPFSVREGEGGRKEEKRRGKACSRRGARDGGCRSARMAMDPTQNTEDLGEELHAACQQAYSEKFLEVEERLGRKECDKIPDMHDKKKARTSGGMATYLH